MNQLIILALVWNEHFEDVVLGSEELWRVFLTVYKLKDESINIKLID